MARSGAHLVGEIWSHDSSMLKPPKNCRVFWVGCVEWSFSCFFHGDTTGTKTISSCHCLFGRKPPKVNLYICIIDKLQIHSKSFTKWTFCPEPLIPFWSPPTQMESILTFTLQILETPGTFFFCHHDTPNQQPTSNRQFGPRCIVQEAAASKDIYL